MSVLYIVLPLAILMASAALCAFIISVRRGQFDDLDTPQLRMLYDDEPKPRTEIHARSEVDSSTPAPWPSSTTRSALHLHQTVHSQHAPGTKPSLPHVDDGVVIAGTTMTR